MSKDEQLRGEGVAKIEAMRKAMQSEMLKVLDKQQTEEKGRKNMLKGVSAKERKRLEKIFAIERAKESDDIIRLST